MSYICLNPLNMNLNNPELEVAQEPVLEAVRAPHTAVTRKPQRIAAFLAQAGADPSIWAALVTEAAPITLLEPLQHAESPERRSCDCNALCRRGQRGAACTLPIPGAKRTYDGPPTSLQLPQAPGQLVWTPQGPPCVPPQPCVPCVPLYNPGDTAIKTEEQWLDFSQLESGPDFELWEAPAHKPSGPSMKKEE